MDFDTDYSSDGISTISCDTSSVSSDDFIYSDESTELSSDDDTSSISSEDSNSRNVIGSTIDTSLVFWAIEFGISHSALTSLLKIIIRFGFKDDLPRHAKTLLNTPRTSIQTRDCAPGKLAYFGIEKGLMEMEDERFVNQDNISLNFYIDGMSTSKSSKWEIWPILASLVGTSPDFLSTFRQQILLFK